LESFPYRVVTSFRRSGRDAPDPASTRFSAPKTTSLELAPNVAVRPGPPRFRSQVLSTSQRFPGTSELCGLVPCRCRPWGSPFRALLLAGIACASRRRMLPCSFSTVVPEVRCARPRPPGFTRRPRSWRGGLASTGARTSFPPPGFARSRVRACNDFPDVLDLTHRSHLVPAASAASKLSSPREFVRTARRFRGRTAAGALLGFAPPEP
jgi:hypothetical protein